jgi:hypothetical protein
MGRKANWPPKVIPHRPSGRDRVRWKGDDYYLGPIGSPESRAAYVELIRKLSQGRDQEDDPASLTVASLIALWHVHAASECDPREVENYRHALRPLVALYGGTRAAAFDVLSLRRLQQAMAAKWCRNVVNRSITRVRTVFRWAEMERHVAPGTWAALRALPPLGRPRPGVRETARVGPVEWWRLARTALASPPGPPRSFIADRLGHAPGLVLEAAANLAARPHAVAVAAVALAARRRQRAVPADDAGRLAARHAPAVPEGGPGQLVDFVGVHRRLLMGVHFFSSSASASTFSASVGITLVENHDSTVRRV